MECRWAWKAKKERLARQYAALCDLEESAYASDGDRMDIDDPVTSDESSTPTTPIQRETVAWFDEWSRDLDQIYLNIEKYMQDLRLEEQHCAQQHQDVWEESSNTLAQMQDGLMRCLMVVQNGRTPAPEIDNSSGDSIMTDSPVEGFMDSDSASTKSPESYTTVSSSTSSSSELHGDSSIAGPGVAVIPFSGLSSGEIVLKFVLKWRGPRGPCTRDTKRIVEDRITEVDGLIH